MRISSLYQYQSQIDKLSSAMNRYNDDYTRLSSLQMILKPSDDPAASSQAIIYQNSLAQLEQYDTARQHAEDMLGQQDNILNSVSNILTKNLAEKIVAGGNGTYSAEDREALAQELEGIRDTLMGLANSRNSNGRYIFAGYNTGKAPFEEDGTYIGGSTPMTQKVADSTEMQVSFTGSEVFLSGSEHDPFNALNNAIDALREPIEDDAGREKLQQTLDSANVAIKKNIDNLGKVQATIGTNLQQLEMLGLSSETSKIDIQTRLEQTLGNGTEAFSTMVTQSKLSEFALQSSFMVFQSMQQLSLFNMLR
ncbi:flagellar hook-associated protein FlgL [Mixta tenebrionis]|uniref:Flagellar hook-associated protein 3 n=1 Tax=Mixta tenebrionis TaxID=2562439 RepID=A0A506V4W0_9GAMM|nr:MULTISPECIES: flagellar hook-associated protein FlgL [Mixta]QHM77499.1 Flagellar hook-associated protein 3 [Mixta theicola]TPW40667.1 flagellar hook-associated protein 3 [Mixta tenebrionis]